MRLHLFTTVCAAHTEHTLLRGSPGRHIKLFTQGGTQSNAMTSALSVMAWGSSCSMVLHRTPLTVAAPAGAGKPYHLPSAAALLVCSSAGLTSKPHARKPTGLLRSGPQEGLQCETTHLDACLIAAWPCAALPLVKHHGLSGCKHIPATRPHAQQHVLLLTEKEMRQVGTVRHLNQPGGRCKAETSSPEVGRHWR